MRKYFTVCVVLSVLVLACLGCGESENPLLVNNVEEVRIAVENIEVVYYPNFKLLPSKFTTEMVGLWLKVSLENLGDPALTINNSSFALQDIKEGKVYDTQEVTLFDPDEFPLLPQTFEELAYSRDEKFQLTELVEVSLKPGSKIRIGIFSLYELEKQNGNWFLVFEGTEAKTRIEIALQPMINPVLDQQKELASVCAVKNVVAHYVPNYTDPVLHTPRPRVRVWVWLSVKNVSDGRITVQQEDFVLEERAGPAEYGERKFRLFDPLDPDGEISVANGYSFPEHCVTIPHIAISPKETREVGLYTIYKPDDLQGELHIVYQGQGKVDLLIQSLINDNMVTVEDPA